MMAAAAAAAEGRSSASSASTPPPSNFHTGMQSPARVVGGSCVSAFFHLFEWNPTKRFSLASRRHHLPPGTLSIFPHLVIGLCVRCVAHLFRTLVREVASVSYILVRLETDFPGAVVGDNFSKRSLKQLEDRQATAPGSSASSQFLQVTTLSHSSRSMSGVLLDTEGSSNRIIPSKLHYQASCWSDPRL
jgi:hypothetical protein